jgi:hypothetical protein
MAHISTLFVGTFSTLLAIGAIQKRTGFRLNRQEWIVILLIALSIIGIGVTDFSPAVSHWYWLAMVPVFGLFCILIEWDRAEGEGQGKLVIMRKQLLQWLGLLLAVQLVYLLLHAGRLDNENTGLVIPLLLALTVYASGVHLEWRLCVVGVLLGLALIMPTYLEEFIWLIMILMAVVAVFIYFAAKYSPTKSGGQLQK